VSALFDLVRHISSADAAERAGIPLERKGGSYWCCCPFHGEKTPSLKFYEGDRGWVCYACHKGGDAVKLYEELYHLEPVDAAKALAGAFGIAVDETAPAGPPAKPNPTEMNLQHKAEKHFNARWAALCDELHEADAVLERLHALGQADWDNPIFVSALRLHSSADERLDAIKDYGIIEKVQMYRAEVKVDERQGGGGPGAS
jgi:DNA primase